MKVVQEINEQQFNAGLRALPDIAQTKFNRYQAELWLEQAKAKR